MAIDEVLPWVWFILAVVLAAAEIFTAGFVLICFGLGALVAAVLAFLGFDFVVQLAAFALVSVVGVILSRPLAERISNPNTGLVGIDRVLGKEGVVLEAIIPDKAQGLVRVEREQWSAVSADGQPIPVGARVKVMAVDGVRLKVHLLDPLAQ